LNSFKLSRELLRRRRNPLVWGKEGEAGEKRKIPGLVEALEATEDNNRRRLNWVRRGAKIRGNKKKNATLV